METSKETKSKEKSIPLNNFLLPLLFIVFAIIFEMANFLYLGFRNADGNLMVLPSYFLFDLAIILMLAGLIYVVQNKIAVQILYYFLLFVQCALNIANSTMYSIFGDILSFDLFYLGGEATSSLSIDLIDWGGVFLNFGLFALMVTASILLVKYNKRKLTVKYFSKSVIVLALFILAQSMGLGLYQAQEYSLAGTVAGETEIESSDKYLWDNFQFKLDAFKKFGNYGFYTKSVLNLMFNEEVPEDQLQSYSDYIDAGYHEADLTAPLYGDNLIVILCESLDWFGIDPYNTPTLYSLASGNNSIVFTNFYARNRTNNSEGIVLNGSMPKDISINATLENGYNFDYALPKLFKATSGDVETVVNYVHCNDASYYGRDVTHTQGLGFDNLYTLEDYTGDQVKAGWGKWISDYDFTKNQIDNILPDTDRFMTMVTMMSSHGPYTYDNPYFQEYYQTYLDNYEKYAEWNTNNTDFILPEKDDEIFMHYKGAIMDMDRTVENIITELKTRGLEDNTSIVLFADHNVYYNDLSLKLKGIDKSEYYETYAYNIPLMIYSPKLTNGEGIFVDDFCNTYDVLPTICDIYGLPYNSNLLLGYSIFSEEIKDSFFVSYLNGMFTENIYSLNITDIFIVGENVTEEEIAKFNENANKFYNKLSILEAIYENGINGTINLTSSYV